MPWLVRPEGSPRPVELPTAQRVLEGVADGDFAPTDEVRGPAEAGWRAIEAHPQFAEAVEDLDRRVRLFSDDDRLDFNPLIDVALVLLIFFILTATYSSLRRAIDLPPGPPDGRSGGQPVVKQEDLPKDKTFLFRVWQEDGRTLFKLEERTLLAEEVERAVIDHVRATGRKELLLDVGPGVEWGEVTRVYDAAKAAEVHQINRLYKK